jgi:5-methyltetrahydropteroyltriglutamate--homocysteine methyltransferase
MAIASNLGFPRIGARRELKRAVERYWANESSPDELARTAAELRRRHWELQRDAGIGHIPSNDFSLYDHVLDTALMVGAVPARFGGAPVEIGPAAAFALARGTAEAPPMDMTKWFDTNYHYIVPEFEPGQTFRLAATKPIDEYREAAALGIQTRPVLLGPVSFLLLGKSRDGHENRLELLDGLLPVYIDVLSRLASAGADWVQLDEPVLALDLDAGAAAAFHRAYDRLAREAPKLRLLLAAYFDDLQENLELLLSLPAAAYHLDLVRGPGQLDRALDRLREGAMLSLGIIDGRNVWRADLDRALEPLERATRRIGAERLLVAPSCSLLHCPIDLEQETSLDAELKGWLAFGRQKLEEIAILTRALNAGPAAVADVMAQNRRILAGRRSSARIHNPAVKARAGAIDAAMLRRTSPHEERIRAQEAKLALPRFPTTTIGSFPQTPEVRKARAALAKGTLTPTQYESFIEQEIARTLRFQEEIGLDVLVHGEFERKDMVEYFGEQLEGIGFTQHGWVQSYGSRYVKPPIIFGDVARPGPMTVRWSRYAQSVTSRPVKGMLTGPVTILRWSFVRDDQPARDTAYQLALALRDEVIDLERAGIRIIQIDEPAFREGLPLRRAAWPAYLDWAVNAFRLTASGVRDETQIQTHMCYSEFNDIIESIAAMDADVILIEASRSDMELLDAFVRFRYPNRIGPGIYDIHSPRVPSVEEMTGRLRKALAVLRPEQLWVNPDCGLKTRDWPEVRASLTNLVAAARRIRENPAGAGSPSPASSPSAQP